MRIPIRQIPNWNRSRPSKRFGGWARFMVGLGLKIDTCRLLSESVASGWPSWMQKEHSFGEDPQPRRARSSGLERLLWGPSHVLIRCRGDLDVVRRRL